MPPIRLALCCQYAPQVEGMCKVVQPGYDIVHVCMDLATSISELPNLLRGKTPKPSSGHGSNANGESLVSGSDIQGILIGGGWTPEDAEKIWAACEEVKPMVFFTAEKKVIRPAGATGPPSAAELKKRLADAFNAAPKTENGQWKIGKYPF